MVTRAAKNLTAADVVDAAIDVLDGGGLDGLTMRRVATRLGVQLNTVYWHASSKPELLELVADALLAGCAQSCTGSGWQQQLLELMDGYRQALLRHRDGARLVAGTYSVMDNTLALSEKLTSVFLAAGFSEQVATWATWHVSSLVLGLAVEQQNEPDDWTKRLDSCVDATRYPTVDAVRDRHTAGDHDARFAFSCDLLLRGLNSLLRETA